MIASEQPDWVCWLCGQMFGHKEQRVSTWHEDTCGVCGERALVTEPRDFGYLNHAWLRRKG
jgi:hypothetical protein